MITQTPQFLRPPIDSIGNDIGIKFRDSLRRLGAIHMCKRNGKLYTIDVPFSLKMSKNGDSIIVVVEKASLPRTYPPQSLVDARDWLETSIGMPIQILDRKDVLAVCCQISSADVYPIAV